MTIVENSPEPRVETTLFENILTLEGMSRAVVETFTVYHADSKESHHVLTVVDLVPDELPRVDVSPKATERLGSKSRWSAWRLCRLLPAQDAVTLYDRILSTGSWALENEPDAPRSPVPLAGISNEPRWPSMILRHDARAIPLHSRFCAHARMHHCLSDEPKIAVLLNASELQKLHTCLKSWTGLDFSKSPELLQSAHIFQPLPLLRYVGTRLDAEERGPDRGILIDIVPRAGATLNGLEVHVLEKRPTGVRLLTRQRADRTFYRLPLSEDVQEITLRVYHDTYGLLLEEGPHAFLRGINTRLKLQSGERRVQVPADKHRKEEFLRIPLSTYDLDVSRGGDTRGAVATLVALDQRTRSPSDGIERWFNNDLDGALRLVRDLLKETEQEAWLVDPYFAAPEVRRWLPVVAEKNAQVRVLTSRRGLAVRARERGGGEREETRALKDEIDHVISERGLNPVDVRTMLGSEPDIHDRFLVVDQRVWLLGSSLNAFGARGTMVIELRRPGPVLGELQAAWHRAETLEQRLEKSKTEADGSAS